MCRGHERQRMRRFSRAHAPATAFLFRQWHVKSTEAAVLFFCTSAISLSLFFKKNTRDMNLYNIFLYKFTLLVLRQRE